MKHDPLIPQPAMVQQESVVIQNYDRYVVPSYARSLVLTKGKGSYVWDESGKRYLDFSGGVAVNCLGHSHPAIVNALKTQAEQAIHVSNLFYHPQQGELAKRLVGLIGPGKVFFCNSGAEANEMLFKLAKLFGHNEGKYEIITAINSFHGRTTAGIAATGQDKVKKGFEPIIPGFKHVPFNDLKAAEAAITPQTAAILIEGVQGEGGVTPATSEYLLGLRRLCDEKKILLLLDAVQCGVYRTGAFMSYGRILEGLPERTGFLPDGIAMAKSLGGGFPIGAVWLKEPYANLFQPGTHGSTYGGTPLGCAVALAVLDTIEREHLIANILKQEQKLKSALNEMAKKADGLVKEVRGFGLLLGVVVKGNAAEICGKLRSAGLLTVPAGAEVIRLLPPFNVSDAEVEEALGILRANL